jgi:hypothetical protein
VCVMNTCTMCACMKVKRQCEHNAAVCDSVCVTLNVVFVIAQMLHVSIYKDM